MIKELTKYRRVGPCGKCWTMDCENCPINDLDGKKGITKIKYYDNRRSNESFENSVKE